MGSRAGQHISFNADTCVLPKQSASFFTSLTFFESKRYDFEHLQESYPSLRILLLKLLVSPAQSDLREEKIPKIDRGRLDVIQAGHRTKEEYIACFGSPRIIVPSECGE